MSPSGRAAAGEAPWLAGDPHEPEIPEGARPEYAALMTKIQNVINALVKHPAIRENKALLDSDPSRAPPQEAQNKVYFMWDFMRNSRIQLERADPKLSSSARGAFQEVQGRSAFASILVREKPGEKLSMMTNEKKGEELVFGQEIKKAVDELVA